MSCFWVGYMLVMPKEPNFTEGREALARVQQRLAPIIDTIDGDIDEDTEEALRREVQALLSDAACESLWHKGAVREIITCAQEALNSASRTWPPYYIDGDYRSVGDKLFLFAGDCTCGDRPEGFGYELLRGLNMFKSVADALGVE